MWVFLALQALSRTMIDMIQDYCKPMIESGMGLGDIDDYELLLQIIAAVNRLDIMNGVWFKNGKDKEVYLIDSPQHTHIFELFDILRLFKDWKNNTDEFAHEFITRQTYEDSVWMVFGVTGIACTYLGKDESIVFHQGRSGSDVCELFFAMICDGNPNPNTTM